MEFIVNAKDTGEFLNLSERRINQLAADGIITKQENGKFDLRKISEEYYLFKHGDSDSELGLDAEKAKHEALKCRLTEIKLAHTENRMHAAEDIERVLTDMLVTFRMRILGVPAGVSPKLVNQQNAGVISNLLTKELKSALTELSEYNPEMFVPEGDDFADKNNSTD